jgi:peptidoglycan/LPS O-acetylase OafA/YrhL
MSSSERRLVGLDGIRGLAALFVMLHHCWLLSFPGYPRATGPLWSNWLIYGHFAVVIFIVLSGFSLAVSPARHDWELGGGKRFAHRRAWRILPPYWAALAISLLIAWFVVPQPNTPAPDAKSVFVYGLLLQDIFGAHTPNGAFWSIAIEAQLYLVFPLMLIVVRRAGAAVMLAGMTALVMLVGALAPYVSVVDMLMRLTPQFAALFALGAVAAGILRASERWRRCRGRGWPWPRWCRCWRSSRGRVRCGRSSSSSGSTWRSGRRSARCWRASRSDSPPGWSGLLDTRPIRSLGSFSYSLYLIHAPIVVFMYTRVVAPRVSPGVPRFLTMLLVAAPLAVLGARLFAGVFELPFTRNRTWPALKAAMQSRLAS